MLNKASTPFCPIKRAPLVEKRPAQRSWVARYRSSCAFCSKKIEPGHMMIKLKTPHPGYLEDVEYNYSHFECAKRVVNSFDASEFEAYVSAE